jgi:hypothetical protein
MIPPPAPQLHLKKGKKDWQKSKFFQALVVAHACNPSYSGGRDQEDRGSKPAWANSFRDPISKKKKKSIS